MNTMQLKLLLNRYLLILFFLTSGSLKAQTNCKEVKAEIEVSKADGNQVVKIDFKGQKTDQLTISLVGPKGYLKTDIEEKEIKGLASGKYTLVINGRREGEYCLKHFQFTIE